MVYRMRCGTGNTVGDGVRTSASPVPLNLSMMEAWPAIELMPVAVGQTENWSGDP
jgi:hypothetical protein